MTGTGNKARDGPETGFDIFSADRWEKGAVVMILKMTLSPEFGSKNNLRYYANLRRRPNWCTDLKTTYCYTRGNYKRSTVASTNQTQ